MIESQPLDIWTEGLYSSYSYDYPMESQQSLFRYSSDSDLASEQVAGIPLNQGAKKLFICLNCNKSFYDYASENRKLCSNNCRFSFSINPSLKSKIKCELCNKSITRYKSQLKYNKWSFCSKDCQIIWQKLNSRVEYKEVLKNRSKKWLNKAFEKYSHIKIFGESEQMLIGSLLGDGHLRKKLTTQYKIGHCLKQKEYLLWKMSLLNLPMSKLRYRINGISKNNEPYYACYIDTKHLPQLNKYHKMFYPNGKKVVTKEILDKLKPLGMAIWYMDDGCLRDSNIVICSQSFTYPEHILIKNYFKNKFDIDVSIERLNIKNYGIYYRTLIKTHKQMKKFINIVQPYIIESMKYKIDLESQLNKRHINSKKYRKTHKFQEWYKQYTSTENFKLYKKKYSRKYSQQNSRKIQEYKLFNKNRYIQHKRNWYSKNKDNLKFKLKRKIYKQRYNIKKKNIKNSFKLIFGVDG